MVKIYCNAVISAILSVGLAVEVHKGFELLPFNRVGNFGYISCQCVSIYDPLVFRDATSLFFPFKITHQWFTEDIFKNNLKRNFDPIQRKYVFDI